MWITIETPIFSRRRFKGILYQNMAAESIKECFCLFYKTVIAFIRTFTECPREKNE